MKLNDCNDGLLSNGILFDGFTNLSYEIIQMGYVHTCDINPPAKSEWTLKEILAEIDDAAMNLPNPTYWVIQEDLEEIWKRYGGEKSKPRWIPVEERLPEAPEIGDLQ